MPTSTPFRPAFGLLLGHHLVVDRLVEFVQRCRGQRALRHRLTGDVRALLVQPVGQRTVGNLLGGGGPVLIGPRPVLRRIHPAFQRIDRHVVLVERLALLHDVLIVPQWVGGGPAHRVPPELLITGRGAEGSATVRVPKKMGAGHEHCPSGWS
ncbi:MAG: hypothetical protein ACRDSL_24590 [Pseudonocardiaceae bacterium]